MPGFVRFCSANEVLPGSVKAVRVENREVAVFNLNGRFYAAQDACPHADSVSYFDDLEITALE
jgi:nitrite reductase (NADH) small subunit